MYNKFYMCEQSDRSFMVKMLFRLWLALIFVFGVCSGTVADPIAIDNDFVQFVDSTVINSQDSTDVKKIHRVNIPNKVKKQKSDKEGCFPVITPDGLSSACQNKEVTVVPKLVKVQGKTQHKAATGKASCMITTVDISNPSITDKVQHVSVGACAKRQGKRDEGS